MNTDLKRRMIMELIADAKDLKVECTADVEDITKPGQPARIYRQGDTRFVITGLTPSKLNRSSTLRAYNL